MRATTKWYQIQNKADAAEIMIYGNVGESWDGSCVSAKSFNEELRAIKA